MLGGAATHFSLAASFFTDVRVVGVVGDDFGQDELAVFEERGIDTDDLERVPGGATFFWRGRYDFDLTLAHTLDTQLNVFARVRAALSPACARVDRRLPRQHPARPPASACASSAAARRSWRSTR